MTICSLKHQPQDAPYLYQVILSIELRSISYLLDDDNILYFSHSKGPFVCARVEQGHY